MAIEIYRGEYVTAEDASKLIDTNSLKKQCDLLNEAAQQLDAIARKVQELRSICNKNAISVNEYSMEKEIDSYKKQITNLSSYLRKLSANLINAAQKVINRNQVIFNEKAKEENRIKAIQAQYGNLDEYTTV